MSFLSFVSSVPTSVGPIASAISSCGHSTTAANGNRNSLFASGWSRSQRMIVGSSQASRPFFTSRGVPRICSVRSTAPGVCSAPSIIAFIRSAIAGLAKAAICASGWSAGRASTFASRSASASAIASAFFGVQTPEALMHDRPPLAAMEPAIRSRCFSHSLGRVLAEDHLAVTRARAARRAGRGPRPWSCDASPKSIERSVTWRIVPEPPWSVG